MSLSLSKGGPDGSIDSCIFVECVISGVNHAGQTVSSSSTAETYSGLCEIGSLHLLAMEELPRYFRRHGKS